MRARRARQLHRNVLLVVERRGLSERSEKFRINTTSVPPIDATQGDRGQRHPAPDVSGARPRRPRRRRHRRPDRDADARRRGSRRARRTRQIACEMRFAARGGLAICMRGRAVRSHPSPCACRFVARRCCCSRCRRASARLLRPARLGGDERRAEMNANLDLPARHRLVCRIAAQTIDRTRGGCPSGCDLDFGVAPVTFDGTFTIGERDAHAFAPRRSRMNKQIAANGSSCGRAHHHRHRLRQRRRRPRRPPTPSTSPPPGPAYIRLFSACRHRPRRQRPAARELERRCRRNDRSPRRTTIAQVASPARHRLRQRRRHDLAAAPATTFWSQRPIDVRSLGDGEGGSITLRAGDRDARGSRRSAARSPSAPTSSRTAAPTATARPARTAATSRSRHPVRSWSRARRPSAPTAAAPDGGGGLLTLGTQEPPAGVLTPLDGDVTLLGPIILRGATERRRRRPDGVVGRAFQMQGALDMSGGGEDGYRRQHRSSPPAAISGSTAPSRRTDASRRRPAATST